MILAVWPPNLLIVLESDFTRVARIPKEEADCIASRFFARPFDAPLFTCYYPLAAAIILDWGLLYLVFSGWRRFLAVRFLPVVSVLAAESGTMVCC